MISLLDETVDSELLERCPLSDQQLSNDLSVPTQVPNPCFPIEDSCLATVSNNPASECQDELNDILSFNDLEKEYSSDDWDKYFATQLPCLQSEIEMDVPECHSLSNIGQGPRPNVSDEEEDHNSDVQALELQVITHFHMRCG